MRALPPPGWQFGNLEPGAYDLGLADPPWKFETRSSLGEEKSASAHYEVQGLDWICSLPVSDLFKEDALLVLWTTKDQLAAGNAHKVISSWGFEPVTMGAWSKQTKSGGLAFGTGFYFRGCLEYFLVAKRGRGIGLPADRSIRDLIEDQIREHSRKPEVMRDNLERMYPNARRCDLFARQSRAGWDCWGTEVDKFPGILV